jgi:hypothetical protein
MLKFSDGTRSAAAVPLSVSAVTMDASVAVIVAAATVAVITTIITTVAIIAVVVISSPLARLDLHGLALAARGARVAQRHMACVVRGCGAKRMGGLDAGCEGT